MGRMYSKWWSYSWLGLTCLFCLLIHKKGAFCGQSTAKRPVIHKIGLICGQHVLPNWSFDAEYEHDVSVLCLKSMYYRQDLFVLPTPEYGQRTWPFCILLYASIIRGQHVRSPLFTRRCAQGRCHPRRRMRFLCADVRGKGETCAGRMPPGVWDKGPMRTCQEKCRGMEAWIFTVWSCKGYSCG